MRQLQPGSLFIHTSRGGIADESAIASAIADNNISLSIDVWKQEPDYDLHLARCADIASPHISGHSDDGIIDAAGRLLDIYERFSGNAYDSTIIASHKSTTRQRVTNFASVAELRLALHDALRLEQTTTHLRNIESDNKEDRMKIFQQLRSSYTGRTEILIP
jgi:hypothetical protein